MDLYGFLKVTSLIATAGFSALALLTKYKDDNGTITKPGAIALGGIILSLAFSVGLYNLETAKAKEAADKAKEAGDKAKADAEAMSRVLQNILSNAQTTTDDLKTTLEQQRLNLEQAKYISKGMERSLAAQQSVLTGNKVILHGVTNTVNKQGELLGLTRNVLTESDRLLHPLYDVRFSYELKLNLNHALFRDYITQLKLKVKDLPPNLPSSVRPPSPPVLYTESNRPRILIIPPGSSWFPKEGTKEHKALSLVGQLDIYREPIKLQQAPTIDTAEFRKSDLGLLLVERDRETRDALEYNLDDGSLFFVTYLQPANKEYWQGKGGAIISVNDVLASQLVIQFWNKGLSKTEAASMDVMGAFDLNTFVLNASNRLFIVQGKEATGFRSSSGGRIYVLSGSQLKERIH